jgi:hypothetical protein
MYHVIFIDRKKGVNLVVQNATKKCDHFCADGFDPERATTVFYS